MKCHSHGPRSGGCPTNPRSPSVIEIFHYRKNYVTEPFTVNITNPFRTGTVTPGKRTFLHRPPDTPSAAAVATLFPIPQEAEHTPEESREILRNLSQQQSWKKTCWLPEIPASRPSEKVDHSKCGLTLAEEPPPEVITRLLEEFPDVFANLQKGLPKSRPTDHPITLNATQTPSPCPPTVPNAGSRSGGNQEASRGTRSSRKNPTLDESFWC